MAASYEARAHGVRGAMGGAQARRLCPERSWCSRAGRPTSRPAGPCSTVFEATSPAVERLSIDEAFLDVRGLEHIAGTPRRDRGAAAPRRARAGRLADHGRRGAHQGLAKVASGAAKPDGLLVVPPDGERAFLHPLPVERLWGVGPATAAKLHAHGLAKVGQVAGCPRRR